MRFMEGPDLFALQFTVEPLVHVQSNDDHEADTADQVHVAQRDAPKGATARV